MASITRFSAVIFTIILFITLYFLCSTCEPVILASPAILPYVTAPNMSSFFPSSSSATSPSSEAPVPSTGEFIGKSSSTPAKFDGGVVIFCARLCFLLVISSVFFLGLTT
ncbi:hypothetical protein ACOSP7_002075 [Xanthoceras sorbifolium]